MIDKIKTKKIAILATDGVEESELAEPMQALKDAGAKVEIVSLKAGTIKAWKHDNWGQEFKVNRTLDEADASDYQGLVLPGGVINADTLRGNPEAVGFVTDYVDRHGPVAAICHGAWILIEADAVNGRKMTSWPSLRTDLENAGAHWSDREVIIDHGLVTSRKPADLPAFNRHMLEVFGDGVHLRRSMDEQSDEDRSMH